MYLQDVCSMERNETIKLTVRAVIQKIVDVYAEAFRLAYAGYSYRELRVLHKDFNSQIDANAIMEMV